MEGKMKVVTADRKRKHEVVIEASIKEKMIEEIQNWLSKKERKRILLSNCSKIIVKKGYKGTCWTPEIMMEVWREHKQSERSKDSYEKKKKKLDDANERAKVAEEETNKYKAQVKEQLTKLEEEIQAIKEKADRKVQRIHQKTERLIKDAKEEIEGWKMRVEEAEQALANVKFSHEEKQELERENSALNEHLQMLEREREEGEEKIRRLAEAVRQQQGQATGGGKELEAEMKEELTKARKEAKAKQEEIKEIETEKHALQERVRIAEEKWNRMTKLLEKMTNMVFIPGMLRLVTRILDSSNDRFEFDKRVLEVSPPLGFPDWTDAMEPEEVKKYVISPAMEIYKGHGEKRAYCDQSPYGLLRFVRNMWAHPADDLVEDALLYKWVDKRWSWLWPVLAMMGPQKDCRLNPDEIPLVKVPINLLKKRYEALKEKKHQEEEEVMRNIAEAEQRRREWFS